jgi:hypothetical protein
MGLYRKATPDELDEAFGRQRVSTTDAAVSTKDRPVSTTESARRPRTADRHKDPKAHSAKTAARAKAKRAAGK